MKQLTIAHLAPYLPYGLEVLDDDNVLWKLQALYSNAEVAIVENDYNAGCYEKGFEEIKPILKPLIEIKKILEIMDEFSEYSWNTFENTFFLEVQCLNWKDFVTYEIAELCFKHHLDLFNLIKGGLAIDYNSLKV